MGRVFISEDFEIAPAISDLVNKVSPSLACHRFPHPLQWFNTSRHLQGVNLYSNVMGIGQSLPSDSNGLAVFNNLGFLDAITGFAPVCFVSLFASYR